MPRAKKLLPVLATFFSMTGASKEAQEVIILDWVLYIYYLVQFKKNEVRALIDLSSKVNVMTLEFAAKLGLNVCSTNVEAQKIAGSTLKTFEMVPARF